MKKQEQGSAMIVALCVMTVVSVLSLSLLLAASNLHRYALRSYRLKQAQIAAHSVLEVLKDQIVKFEYRGYPTADRHDREDSLEGRLASVCTDAWPAFEPEAGRTNTCFTYDLADCGMPGDTVLELYWIDGSGEGIEELDPEDPEAAAAQFTNALLYVTVTNTIKGQSSTAANRFYPEVDIVTRTETAGEEPVEKAEWIAWRWRDDGRVWKRRKP